MYLHCALPGDHGQLGQGGSLTEPYMTLPTQVEHLPWIGEKTEDGSEVSVQQVAVGHDHSVVLTTSGKIYVCGSNDFSQARNTN